MARYVGLEDKRILIVEDVELNQCLARYIMESWGCIVAIAENGRLAVEMVNESDFDLVLMDIQMPEMDGKEATRLIRGLKDAKKSSIPIIALTANALKEDCESYIALGMNDWLAKPFEEPSLYKTISKNIMQSSKANGSNTTDEKKGEKTGDVIIERMYDMSMVEGISGGDKTFVKRMLVLFLETVPITLSDMRSSAEKGEWLALSKHAHKLKSTIDSMGIKFLKQEIRLVETGGKNGEDPALLLALVENVISGMQLVMEKVREDYGV